VIVMLDTNILIYHLTHNHPAHSRASTALMRNVEAGKQEVYCPSTAIMECVFVLEKQFKVQREKIASLVAGFLAIPAVHCEYKRALFHALAFWQGNMGLDFADCYHLALAEELGMTQIYSFDKRMDRYPGIERIEPELPDESTT